MTDLKAVEGYFREDQTRECKVTKHNCENGDCRVCGFAQEQFRFEQQLKLEAYRREQLTKPITVAQCEGRLETETLKTRKGKT